MEYCIDALILLHHLFALKYVNNILLWIRIELAQPVGTIVRVPTPWPRSRKNNLKCCPPESLKNLVLLGNFLSTLYFPILDYVECAFEIKTHSSWSGADSKFRRLWSMKIKKFREVSRATDASWNTDYNFSSPTLGWSYVYKTWHYWVPPWLSLNSLNSMNRDKVQKWDGY